MTTRTVVVKLTGESSELKKAINEVDKEFAESARQVAAYQQTLGRLKTAQTTVAKNMGSNTAAIKEQGKAAKIMRSQMQNVGYQLQDTAVQLEMGTHWTRVFGQQGSQLLGMFGAWPSILGAAGAAILAVGANMGWFGEETVKVKEAVDTLNESLGKLSTAQKALEDASRGTGLFDDAASRLNELRSSGALVEVTENFNDLGTSVRQLAESDAFPTVLKNMENVIQGGPTGEAQFGQMMKDFNKDVLGLADSLTDLQDLDAGAEILETFEDILETAKELVGVESEAYAALESMIGPVIAYAEARDRVAKLAEDELEIGKGLRTITVGLTADAQDRRAEEERIAQTLRDEDTAMAQLNSQSAANLRLTRERAAVEASILRMLAGGGRGGAVDPRTVGDTTWERQIAASTGGITLEIPKVKRGGGGGGSKREREDPYDKLIRELTAKRDIMTVDKERHEVIKALGKDAAKYSEEQIQAAIDIKAETERLLQVQKDQQDTWDAVGEAANEGITSIVDGTKSIKDAFKDMARSVLDQLFQIFVMQKLIGSVGGAGGGGAGLLGWITGTAADGAVMQHGKMTAFAKGGVVGGPTLFPMSNGTGLMGEAGPEAIVPLSRGSNGELGVGASPVNIQVINNAGADVSVGQSENGGIEIMINRAVKATETAFARSMSTGQGTFARSLESGYNSRRKV